MAEKTGEKDDYRSWVTTDELCRLTGLSPDDLKARRKSLQGVRTAGAGAAFRIDLASFIRGLLAAETADDRWKAARADKAEIDLAERRREVINAEDWKRRILMPFCDAIRLGVEELHLTYPAAAEQFAERFDEAREILLTDDRGAADESV